MTSPNTISKEGDDIADVKIEDLKIEDLQVEDEIKEEKEDKELEDQIDDQSSSAEKSEPCDSTMTKTDCKTMNDHGNGSNGKKKKTKQKSNKKNTKDSDWSPVLTAASVLEMIVTINKSAFKAKKATIAKPTLDEASAYLTENGVVHRAVLSKELSKGGIRFYFRFDDTANKIKAHAVMTDFYKEKYGIDIGELKGGEGDRYRVLLPKIAKIRQIVETQGNLDSNVFNLLYQVSRTVGLGTDSPSRITLIREHLKKLGASIGEESVGISKEKVVEEDNSNTSKKNVEPSEPPAKDDKTEEIIELRNNTNIVKEEHYKNFLEVLGMALSKEGNQSFSEVQKINFMNWQDMINYIFDPSLPRRKPRPKPYTWHRPYNGQRVKNNVAWGPSRYPSGYQRYPVHMPRYNEYARYDRWDDTYTRWTESWRHGPDVGRYWGYPPYYWEGRHECPRHGRRVPWRYRGK